ncbi:tissue factor pathway inhibitor-like [Ixodes scapularis]|uniref:tissue factor pathway inhibitor-like n=1 Tax=Ixodes scapularis TaxID=6945 RepID=UPI001A9D9FF0|nr:tissue factor pathway inhibitor-like [Ixodes scapularis]
MKATFAAVCFLATVVCTIALLPEKICRAPHPVATCTAGEPIKSMFYFDDGTDQCEEYYGCGGGPNDFGSRRACMDACPYGKHKPKSPKP